MPKEMRGRKRRRAVLSKNRNEEQTRVSNEQWIMCSSAECVVALQDLANILMKASDMKLLTVHAYSVHPERTAGTASAPFGGPITMTPKIAAALREASTQSTVQRPIAVDLQVDPVTRTSEIRNLMLDFAFGGKPKADRAGNSFATRLAQAMDRRSYPCLFVVAATSRRISEA